MSFVHGLFGLAVLLALAWCLSAERWHIPYRVVLGGVALQIGLAVLLIKFPPATAFFFMLDDGVAALQKSTDAGTGLVFGYLGGAALPFAEVKPGAGFILAFKAFPLVLVISALASLLLLLGHLAAHRRGLCLRAAQHSRRRRRAGAGRRGAYLRGHGRGAASSGRICSRCSAASFSRS